MPLFSFTDERELHEYFLPSVLTRDWSWSVPATVQARRDAVQAKIDGEILRALRESGDRHELSPAPRTADPTYRIFDNNAVRRSFSEFLLQLPDGAVRRQPCVLGETAYVLDGEQRIFAPADMPMASFWIIPGLNGAMSHARVATVAWPSDSKDKQAAYSHRHVLQAPVSDVGGYDTTH